MIGGFGTAGQPAELIDGLIQLGIKDLTIVSNNAGNGDYGLAKLTQSKLEKVRFVSMLSPTLVFDELYRAGKIELELVPQGNLACRIRRRHGTGAVLPPLATVPYWPKAKKPVTSTVKIMCWNIQSKPTLL
jgi:3-oxoadipate CoA-transferase alpha subunit